MGPSHSEYVTGQVPAGGPVRTSASPDVWSETTWRGTTPKTDTDDRAGPSSTGRRPICSIECTASPSTAADDERPSITSAAGWPQSSRTTGANVAAVAGSMNRTLADEPIDAHSAEAAGTEPR